MQDFINLIDLKKLLPKWWLKTLQYLLILILTIITPIFIYRLTIKFFSEEKQVLYYYLIIFFTVIVKNKKITCKSIELNEN